MAINKNHEFDELNGVKCAIVEKNVKPERVSFIKALLEYNRYTVIVIPTPAPKTAAIAAPKEGEPATTLTPPAIETFTVGVTDVSFNATNAIFGRLLHTKDGRIATLAYWLQKEKTANDEVPYFEN